LDPYSVIRFGSVCKQWDQVSKYLYIWEFFAEIYYNKDFGPVRTRNEFLFVEEDRYARKRLFKIFSHCCTSSEDTRNYFRVRELNAFLDKI